MFKSVWWNKVNRIKKKKIVFSNWNWYWLPLKIKSELDLVQKKKFDVTSLVWTKSPWCESNLPVWMRSRPDWSSWHMTDYLHMLIWSAKLGLCCHIHQRQLLSTFFLPLRLCSVLHSVSGGNSLSLERQSEGQSPAKVSRASNLTVCDHSSKLFTEQKN